MGGTTRVEDEETLPCTVSERSIGQGGGGVRDAVGGGGRTDPAKKNLSRVDDSPRGNTSVEYFREPNVGKRDDDAETSGRHDCTILKDIDGRGKGEEKRELERRW